MISKAFARSAALAFAIAAAGPAVAENNAYGRSPSPLEGSWEVTITPYACATGVEFP